MRIFTRHDELIGAEANRSKKRSDKGKDPGKKTKGDHSQILSLSPSSLFLLYSAVNSRLQSHFFSPDFMDALMDVNVGFQTTVTDYVMELKVLEADKLYFPLYADKHWSLLVVLTQCRHIKYYDSKNENGQEYLDMLLNFMSHECDRNHVCFEGWETSMEKDVPQQLHECDSGVFMCFYVDIY